MIRSRHLMSALVALFALAVVLGPARAQEATTKAEDAKRVVELLSKIDQRLASQQAQSDVLMEIVQKDLKSLREEVNRLQKEVTDLRRTPATTITSNYPQSPSVSSSITTPVQTSNVRLVNTFFTDMTAVVNGLPVSVAPGQTRTIPVPAGAMTFSIPQVSPFPQPRTLAPNETLTLTLQPQW
jgi:hypothetical protein